MTKQDLGTAAVVSPVVGPSKPRLWRVLGPGLITGASDDDPSGIATYTQAGAAFGYQLSWTLVLTYPLMVVIQGISARLGRTTGRGIAGNLRLYYPAWLLQCIVAMLFIANTLNIGANLGAMGEVAHLLASGVDAKLFVVAFGALCIAGQFVFKYKRYVALMKWLTLSLFSYLATLLVVKVEWPEVIRGLAVPELHMSRGLWMMVVAVLGTTISPYLFFWQAAQEVEDTKAQPAREPLQIHPEEAPAALARIKLDTVVGMAFSNVVALAIMVTAAATLHGKHAEIASAAQAAEALRPVAGEFAFGLFAVGIIATGLLSVPVLSGSAAYAIGEARRWPVGLARQPLEAKSFYLTIALAIVLGMAFNAFGMNPMRALVISAVINGIVAVPVMALLVLMSSSERVMGQFVISTSWKAVGWLATALMGLASAVFFYTLLT